ncbi:hypothetical protein BB559_001098 [Furculomyces boomerangus]|uniref:Uncharacterized protein n=2 Tax=Harpellales TaxID=61421 RepID=A0A2T9Z324_9FUNG|nr:hypothetical protein BB559_007059 [Furculomyces boomerangus]PVU98987.1 hypothetical protein BB559_001098 [Furculomyces boomerangus]PVZ97786.1 hypothetical protein BB558_006250 [Smittium angustum]
MAELQNSKQTFLNKIRDFVPTEILGEDCTSDEDSTLNKAVLQVERLHFNHQLFFPRNTIAKQENENAEKPGKKLKTENKPLRYANIHTLEINDVYGWAEGWLIHSPEIKQEKTKLESDSFISFPDIKYTLTYPATEKHIEKCRAQNQCIISETAEMYNNVTKKYIESEPASRIQWVYNILDHKAESERIIFEDKDPQTGFILLPDL